MQKWFMAAIILIIITSSARAEDEALTITLPENAVVAAGDMSLGQVAEVTGPADQVAKLAAVSLGPAPLAGYQRPITVGLIILRLRRAGWNPDGVALAGEPQTMVVTQGQPQPVVVNNQAGSVQQLAPPAPQIVIKRGDTVRIVLSYKGITIVTVGQALNDAAQDQIVRVRVAGSRHTTYGRVANARTVEVKL